MSAGGGGGGGVRDRSVVYSYPTETKKEPV